MKILLVTILTLLALTNSVVDTTIIINIYDVDGYEFIDGKFKRTLRALYHLFF